MQPGLKSPALQVALLRGEALVGPDSSHYDFLMVRIRGRASGWAWDPVGQALAGRRLWLSQSQGPPGPAPIFTSPLYLHPLLYPQMPCLALEVSGFRAAVPSWPRRALVLGPAGAPGPLQLELGGGAEEGWLCLERGVGRVNTSLRGADLPTLMLLQVEL